MSESTANSEMQPAFEGLWDELTAQGEPFERNRVSVFLLLGHAVQVFFERASALNDAGSELERLILAFSGELTAAFEGRRGMILAGYGEHEGWTGEPFNGWLRGRLAPLLTDQERAGDVLHQDDWLVALAVHKMVGELCALVSEHRDKEAWTAEEMRGIAEDVLDVCERWSVILSGDDTELI